MKRALVFVVGFVAAIPVCAQTNLSFLTSRAALLAFAIDQADTASFELGAPSRVGTQAVWKVKFSVNHTSADILRFYTTNRFGINVLNPNDEVSVAGKVFNGDGDQILSQSYSSQPTLTKTGYSLPKVFLNLGLEKYVAIKFDKPVSSAEVFCVDPFTKKTYNEKWLPVSGCKVYFPSASCGTGFLDVKFNDGTESYYDLCNGGIEIPGFFIGQEVASASVDNFLSFTNPMFVRDQIFSQNGVGTNRTYELVIENSHGDGRNVKFLISSTEGCYPLGLWVRPKFGSWSHFPWLAKDYTVILFPEGVWYVIPDWDRRQFHEPDL